ncbi:hypothetical protein V6N13_141667 [Hibiscus sabdariffa]
MNGRDQYEGQLSAGGQNNEGRQEDVANIGGINVEIQPDATEEDPVDYVDPEIPCAESGVEVTVEHDVQSGDESICGDGLLSGGGDEAIADVPEISVTNLPIMSMTGENSDDLMKLSSSDESPKEPEEVAETPTNAKNKRKGKKVVEATSGRGKRKKKSVVWDHFKEIEGDAYHAECVYCSQMISCASSNGTNAMKRHTSRCKKAPFNVDSKQTILDFESKTKCNADGTIETVSVPKLWHFDQDEIRKALARMVIVDELPFSFVEREGFRHFCKIAVPSFVPPSRATITRDCYALFIEKRKKLKNYFSNLSSRARAKLGIHKSSTEDRDEEDNCHIQDFILFASGKTVVSSPKKVENDYSVAITGNTFTSKDDRDNQVAAANSVGIYEFPRDPNNLIGIPIRSASVK